MAAASRLGLPFVKALHFRLHNAITALGLVAHKPVTIQPQDDAFVVTSEGREIWVPSAIRWRMYRRGWANRLGRLRQNFGIPDLVQINQGDHVVDIGANVGEFAIASASLGARVDSIEGDPKVFACLARNIADQPGITTHQTVVWHSEEDLTFYSAPSEADSSLIADANDPRYQPIQVHAVPLDLLAERGGWGEIALLKCDAEGAKPEVLRGATAVLARTRAVAIDTGPERLGQETHEPVAAILTAAGFRVFRDIRKGRKITFGLRA